MENMASCNKAKLSFNQQNMLNTKALVLKSSKNSEDMKTRQNVLSLQERPLFQGQKLTDRSNRAWTPRYAHSQTHKQVSPTKTGEQKLPLLSHL